MKTAILGAFLICGAAGAQTQSRETTEEVLTRASVVSGNFETAFMVHITNDRDFRMNHQLPEDRREMPPILLRKDGTLDFDWTPGQQARYLMEELRQGIHILQSVQKPTGMDAVALAGGREYWPKLRDISCKDKPGTRYYDLDGLEQYCPVK